MKLYPNEPVKICNPWKLNPLKVNDATVLSLFFYISFIKNNFLFLLIKFFRTSAWTVSKQIWEQNNA